MPGSWLESGHPAAKLYTVPMELAQGRCRTGPILVLYICCDNPVFILFWTNTGFTQIPHLFGPALVQCTNTVLVQYRFCNAPDLVKSCALKLVNVNYMLINTKTYPYKLEILGMMYWIIPVNYILC